jgi:hypothetical protein
MRGVRPPRHWTRSRLQRLALLCALAAAISMPLPVAPEIVSRTLRCVISPWSADEVRAQVAGICGPSCGETTRWVVFLEPRIVWDRGTDRESWLVVLRDEPMYAEAEIRDGRSSVIGRCGLRFKYDGDVHPLEREH